MIRNSFSCFIRWTLRHGSPLHLTVSIISSHYPNEPISLHLSMAYTNLVPTDNLLLTDIFAAYRHISCLHSYLLPTKSLQSIGVLFPSQRHRYASFFQFIHSEFSRRCAFIHFIIRVTYLGLLF